MTMITKNDRFNWDHQSSPYFYTLSYILIVALTTIVFLTFQDYGITNDEEVQNVYGIKLLSFYTSFFSDKSAFYYLDLYRYGGFFDLLAAIINLFSPLGEYETRHLLGGVFGLLGIVGVWRLGRYIGGERVGFLALMFLLLTPSYYGQSFNNPKDSPFAVSMVWSCYYFCKFVIALPHPSRSLMIKAGVSWGIALAIRVAAILFIPYFFFLMASYFVLQIYKNGQFPPVKKYCYQLWRVGWPVVFIAYFIMTLCWPWGGMNPLNPIRALTGFATYPINLETLVSGNWVKAAHVPRDYLPEYLFVNLPEFVLVGLCLSFFAMVIWFIRKGHSFSHYWRTISQDEYHYFLKIFLVFLSAFFPVVAFIFFRPTAYNGLRHFLFILPHFILIAALGVDWLWTKVHSLEEKFGHIFAISLTVLFVIQGWIMVQLHPDEYVYYNIFTGGVKGAEGTYELDYWGNSLVEATKELAEYIKLENGAKPITRIYKVSVCGHRLSAAYYFSDFMEYTQKVDESDFLIAFTQHNCHRQFEGKPIISIDRFGVALSVVKDRRYLENKGQ